MKSSLRIALFMTCGCFLMAGGCSEHGDTNYKTQEPPAAPVQVAAYAGIKSLTVTWNPVADATSYNLYYSTSQVLALATAIKVTNVHSPYTLSGLARDTTYYCIVTSLKNGQESIASSQVTGTPRTISIVTGSPQSDFGSAIAADGFGNLYAVGATSGEFDGNTRVGLRDIFLVKYDLSGAKKWSRQIGAANAYSDVNGVVVDSTGYIYLTGTTGGSFDGNIKNGVTDLFLLKYDANGNKIWSRQMGAVNATIETPSIAVDETGSIFVAGGTNAGLGGNTVTGTKDLFLAKYDADGNMLWLQMRGVADQYTSAVGVAADLSGDVIVAGSSCGGFESASATGICDLLLLKYDSNGNKSWARMVGAADAYTTPRAVAVDLDGNSYVTGYTGGNYDGIIKPVWGDNMFLSKFDRNGVRMWSRLLSGGFYAYGYAVAVDSSGSAYVTGDTGNPIDGNEPIGQRDLFVVKYDSDGNKKWSNQFGVSYSSSSGSGVTTDRFGGNNVYIVGMANGDIFTHTPTSSYYDFNFFLAGIDSDTGSY